MSPTPRLVICSLASSPPAVGPPAGDSRAGARQGGILGLADAAHAPAMLPLDVNAVNADFYAGNCHKWLLAPTGSGFLVLGPGSEDRLQPLEVSWGYHPDSKQLDERDEFGSTPRLRFLEFEGTRDQCTWLAVPPATDFQAGRGWGQIRGRIADPAAPARRRLSSELGLTLATPPKPALHGALTAFQLPFKGAQKAVALRKAVW